MSTDRILTNRCRWGLFLAFLFVFLVLQTSALASSSGTCGVDGDDVTWTLNNSGVLKISGTGAMKNYMSSSSVAPWGKEIKSVTISEGVTSIGNYAFYECANLTSITIPSSVITIGNQAFYKCTSLTSVVMSDGVQSIGNFAFGSCKSLRALKLPASLTTLNNGCFSGCSSLTSINLPHQLTAIPQNLFMSDASLTYLVVPESVTSIGKWAFYGCSNLHVQIPDTTTDIGEKILQSATNAVIYCNEFSIIESYARENSYSVILVDSTSNPPELTAVFVSDVDELEAGKTTRWSFSVFPEGGSYPSADDFTFSSSDTSIATIGSNGLIRGKKQGSVTFYARYGDLEYSLPMRIIRKCTSFSLTVDEIGAVMGDRVQLKAITEPAGADIMWQVVMCHPDGTEMSSGITINAKTGLLQLAPNSIPVGFNLKITDGYTGRSVTVPLTVMDPPYSFAFEKPEYVVLINESIQTNCQIKQYQWSTEVYNNRFVEFSSSDPTIASIGPYSGLVTAHSYGRVTITATMGTREVTTSVLVLRPVTSIGFASDPLYVEAKWYRDPKCYTIPSDADSRFTWATGNSLIATVENGIVYGHALGQTQVTVTDEYTGISSSLNVIVRYPVDTVQLSAESLNMLLGESETISAHAFARGTEYTDQVFTFDTSNDSVASVDSSGCIHATGAGEANISVKSENGTEAVCSITVPTILSSNEPINMDLNTSSYIGVRDEYSALSLLWGSNDPSIVSISPSGKITAKAVGSSAITVSIEGNDYQETLVINITDPFEGTEPVEVEIPVQSITISGVPTSIQKGQTITLSATVAPEDATINLVSWRSLDESIVIIDDSGIVTAVAPGLAKVVAIANDGTMVHSNCEFVVRGNSSITLPSATRQVETEAFAYTVADEYYIPSGMKSIGPRAFANLGHTALVHIPQSVTSIADNAFAGSRITICCIEGSFAESWADQHGIDHITE